MSAVLDTHAALWYFHRPAALSSAALQSIRRAIHAGEPVYISAISLVETIYLVERGRLPLEALQRLETGLEDDASGLLLHPVDEDVARAVHRVPRAIVPDMPDRIVAATALHLGLPLVTRDQRIAGSGVRTVW